MHRASQTSALGLLVVVLAVCALASIGRSAEPVAPRTIPVAAHSRPDSGPLSAQAAALRDGRPLDLNAASAAELELLPGIGPALSTRIVEDRGQRGPFPDVDALARVVGIGPRTVERLRPLARASTPQDGGP